MSPSGEKKKKKAVSNNIIINKKIEKNDYILKMSLAFSRYGKHPKKEKREKKNEYIYIYIEIEEIYNKNQVSSNNLFCIP
jgi:hypothetical protein